MPDERTKRLIAEAVIAGMKRNVPKDQFVLWIEDEGDYWVTLQGMRENEIIVRSDVKYHRRRVVLR